MIILRGKIDEQKYQMNVYPTDKMVFDFSETVKERKMKFFVGNGFRLFPSFLFQWNQTKMMKIFIWLTLFVGIDESIEQNFQESKETSIVVGIENKGIGVDPNGIMNI